VECEAEVNFGGEKHLSRIICQALWTHGEKDEYRGAIGKIVGIDEE